MRTYSDYYCLTCEVSYHVFSNWYIFFLTQNEYDISVNVTDDYPKTRLWKNKRIIFSLDYMIDINPSNKDYWFERLIKLKAFL